MLLYRLFATFSHRTSFASDFSFSTLSKIDRKIQMKFLLFLVKKEIFLYTRFLHAKTTFNNDRRSYKKNDVIVEINFHTLSRSRDSIRFDVASLILFLKRFEIERIWFWSMILSNRRLSSDLWIYTLNRSICRSLFFNKVNLNINVLDSSVKLRIFLSTYCFLIVFINYHCLKIINIANQLNQKIA